MEFLIDFFLHVDQHLMAFIQTYHQWTYVLLFLIVFCETGLVVLPFLPGDSLLFVSGTMASLPGTPLHISLLLPILCAAAVLGDSCNYLLGQRFGEKLFTRPDSRLFRQSHLEKTHAFFQQHGRKAVLIARFVPVIRTFTPFVAGMGKMHYPSFMAYNLAGAAVWILVFCLSGYFFGNLPLVQPHLNLLLYGIVLISLSPALIEFLRIKTKLN